MINAYILASTLALALVAAIWSSNGAVNILFKIIFTGLAVVGAICTASVFAITAS